ncbi:uncharacterized protein TNCV_456931 [Trichonephila clavipes]|nr:uncharacterized protein TNCV_456931 [Trichonephila clavipes]
MHRISSRYHVPKARPSERKMQALLKAKKRWASGQLELEHPSFHDNDPNASGHASSNYEKNAKVNTCTLNSSELNTATERKLSLLSHTSLEHLANEQDDTTYVLVDTNIWKNLLSTVKCPKCDMNALNIIKTTQLGMAAKLELVCSSCHAGLELFALVTGMNAMDKKSFSKHIKILSEENSEMKHHILEIARNIVRKQHIDLNDEEKKETGVLDITVSFDGSWQKRGYKSLYGIGVVIDLLTGLVIDYEILSKYCTECTAAVRDLSGDSSNFAIWYEGHKSECQINHTGSSSSMEMEAAAILWQRSIKECNMRYTCILSDGDSKTFQHLMSLNIYGKGKPIKKEECINHISKLLGTGLRSKVKEWRSKGVCIGGKKVGKSQNANESLHSVIWSHCPKESFQSKKRLEIYVVTAVSEFNFGSLFTLKHIHQNALLPSMQISGVRDERRLKQSRKRIGWSYPLCLVGGTSGSEKAQLQENYGPTTDREDRRIHHMAGEHGSASTVEITAFFRHQTAPASSAAIRNENPDAVLKRKAIRPHSSNIQQSYGSF